MSHFPGLSLTPVWPACATSVLRLRMSLGSPGGDAAREAGPTHQTPPRRKLELKIFRLDSTQLRPCWVRRGPRKLGRGIRCHD